jgi:hypothetical protein
VRNYSNKNLATRYIEREPKFSCVLLCLFGGTPALAMALLWLPLVVVNGTLVP